MSARLGTVLALAVVAGCGAKHEDAPASAPAPVRSLALSPVAWNASNADVGTVVAVAEHDQAVSVFGSSGVITLASGTVTARSPEITTWRSAGELSSPDGMASWLVGVDGSGRLQRIVTDESPVDVSAAYGVDGDKVKSASCDGAGSIAFILEDGVAVSDGKNVTHYRPSAAVPAVAAGPSGAAIADGVSVRVYSGGHETDTLLADARHVLYDASGRLFAATSHALYTIAAGSGGASLVYDAGAATIRQIVGSGPAVWLAIDTELASYRDGAIAIADAHLAADATIMGSASGDVWVVHGGQLQRWAGTVSVAATSDEGVWNATVEPIYAAVCSNCHGPPGSGKSSSNIDLSTYAAWTARRTAIHTRVVDQAGTPSAMPPPSSSFTVTDAQRSAIAAWAK